ncbi:MAG TPA: hypothetical protein VJ891_17190 [Casimicrobiaceae bacterium]|nr:hypothetical protein [Casimicrobiaceae bacterium]
MSIVLIDPTLRRARIVRASLVILALVFIGSAALFARRLRAENRDPPSLPSPRKALVSGAKRPARGRFADGRH